VLTTDTLTLGYAARTVVHALDVVLPEGQITALVGPNGCGKSTLLRGLARLLTPRAGTVLLDGRSIHTLPTRALARELAILPQSNIAPDGLTVRELCAQGRYPHQDWLRRWSADDERALHAALSDTGMLPLADAPVDTLSGGQRQRAWIALVLAQDARVLLLDEPTTYLDMGHAIEIMHLLTRLRERGRTVVMVVHDLNMAARYAQHMVALHNGRLVASGTPHAVLTSHLLRSVFDVDADIMIDARSGAPFCVPHGVVPRDGAGDAG
jgi:iron complex transport system ATP-binding protein